MLIYYSNFSLQNHIGSTDALSLHKVPPMLSGPSQLFIRALYNYQNIQARLRANTSGVEEHDLYIVGAPN